MKKYLIVLVCFVSSVFANADYSRPMCSELLDRILVGEKKVLKSSVLNKSIANRYPDLKVVLDDPDRFIMIMENRFTQQKALTPNNPYLFDYSEIAIPLFKKIDHGIDYKLQKLNPKYPANELGIVKKYMTELQTEIKEKLKDGRVTYQDTIELSFFYNNVVGYFDEREMSLMKRNLLKFDRYLEGHKPRSIAVEYQAYKRREFHLFQEEHVSGSSGYVAAQGPFTQAFYDKEKLQTIIVPTDNALTCDIFMSLMSREKINIVGVTADPIMADGFFRPAADFWMHDLRHESGKFHKKKLYLKLHKVRSEHETTLNKKMDQWYMELEAAIHQIEDVDLKKGLELLTFNFYHDRGYPIAPSTFLTADINNIHMGLLAILKISQSGVEFKKPVRTLKMSEQWLRDFWLKKMDEEDRLLQQLSK